MNILLLIFYTITISYPIWSKKFNSFSPLALWSVMAIYTTVPFLYIQFTTGELTNSQVLEYVGRDDMDKYLRIFMFNQTLFAIIYFISYKYIRIKRTAIPILYTVTINKNRCRNISLLLFAVSLLLTFNFISSFGGLTAVLSGFTNRSAIYEDRQIYFMISNFCVYIAVVFYIKYLSYLKRRFWGLLFCIIIGFVVLSVGGGRSPFIFYLLTIGICYNFFIHRISLFSIKFIPIYVCVFFVMILILSLRVSADKDFNTMMSDNFLSIFSGNSYVDIQVTIQKYFETHDYWLGKPFEYFYEAFIPHSFLDYKHSIDDGCYIYPMLQNTSNIFSMTKFYNSWPPGTLGSLYANFGYCGICFGAILYAYIQKKIYYIFISRSSNILLTYLYAFIAVKFQLTLFYLANLCYIIILITMFAFIYRFVLWIKRPRSKL